MSEDLCEIEHLLECVHADHTRGLEQRVDGSIIGCE